MVPMRRRSSQLRSGFCMAQRNGLKRCVERPKLLLIGTVRMLISIMLLTIQHILSLTPKMSQKTTLNVEGMSCGHCVNAVKNLIGELDGIESSEVDLTTKEAKVSFDLNKTNTQAIIENINSSNAYIATEK